MIELTTEEGLKVSISPSAVALVAATRRDVSAAAVVYLKGIDRELRVEESYASVCKSLTSLEEVPKAAPSKRRTRK